MDRLDETKRIHQSERQCLLTEIDRLTKENAKLAFAWAVALKEIEELRKHRDATFEDGVNLGLERAIEICDREADRGFNEIKKDWRLCAEAIAKSLEKDMKK